jgi:hypothetical protein
MIATSANENPQPLLELQQVTKVYGSGEAAMPALRGVSFRIDQANLWP